MAHNIRESDTTIKAIVQPKYGSPEDLELMDIDIRAVKDDEL